MNGTGQNFNLDASSNMYEMQQDPILVGYPSYGLMVESPLAPETSTRSSQVLESSMTMIDQDHQVITVSFKRLKMETNKKTHRFQSYYFALFDSQKI